jgi:ABC-type phosphate transport system permease subunit
MVFPLLAITLVWDRYRANRPPLQPRRVTYGVLGRAFATTRLSLVSAGLFSIMGVVLIVAALTGAELTSPTQVSLAAWVESLLKPVVDALAGVPDAVVGLGLIGVAVGAAAYSGRRREPADQLEQNTDSTQNSNRDRSCHEPVADSPQP